MAETDGALKHAAAWAREKAEGMAGGPAGLKVVLLLAGVLALDAADKATVSVVAGSLKDAFHIDNTQIGLLIAATSFVGAIFTLPFGVLVDRVRRRNIILLAVMLWTAAMVVSGLSESFTFLLVTRVCLGAVTAAAAPTVASMTGDFFPAQARDRIYGMILAGELFGTGIGIFVGGEAASLLGWSWSFYLMAVPSVALLWALWRHLPEPARGGQSWIELRPKHAPSQGGAKQRVGQAGGEDTSQPDEVQRRVREADIRPREELILREDPMRKSLWWAIGYLLRIPSYSLLIAASALGYFLFSGIRAFGIIYFTEHYAISRSALSALILVVGIGAIAGVLLGGRISGWLLGRGWLDARIIVPGVALFTAVLFIAPAVWTTNAVIGITLLTFGAAALAAANAPIDAARLDIIHPRLWGRAESGRMAVRAGLEGGAPVLFGLISKELGAGAIGLERTFLLMLIPALLAASLAIPARRTYPRDVATAAASVEATSTKQ